MDLERRVQQPQHDADDEPRGGAADPPGDASHRLRDVPPYGCDEGGRGEHLSGGQVMVTHSASCSAATIDTAASRSVVMGDP